MIVRQSGKSAVSWFTALVLFFASFGPMLGAVSYILESNPREGTVLFTDLVGSFDYVWEFFFPSLVLFALVYPRRHRWWPWVRKIAWLLFLPHLFHLILVIFLMHRANPARMFQGLGRLAKSYAAVNAFLERLADFLNVFMALLLKAHVQLFLHRGRRVRGVLDDSPRERAAIGPVAARQTPGSRPAGRSRALHPHLSARPARAGLRGGAGGPGYIRRVHQRLAHHRRRLDRVRDRALPVPRYAAHRKARHPLRRRGGGIRVRVSRHHQGDHEAFRAILGRQGRNPRDGIHHSLYHRVPARSRTARGVVRTIPRAGAAQSARASAP